VEKQASNVSFKNINEKNSIDMPPAHVDWMECNEI
jgi:hypothetical protein